MHHLFCPRTVHSLARALCYNILWFMLKNIQIEKIKYFVYTRKSTEETERQIISIQSQKDKLLEMFGNLEIVEVLEEEKSAFKPSIRPVFQRMIERIKKGEALGIIAWHPDRLSRNEIDAGTITWMIRTGEIKDLKFASYCFDNSPEGIMMLQLALSNSQYYSAKLSRDTKRGLQQKLKMGWFPSLAPLGYLNDKTKPLGERTIKKDLKKFLLLKKAWDLMLTGNYTVRQILNTLNNQWGFRTRKTKRQGGKPLSLSGLYKIFTNPFYYGVFEFPAGSGQWWKGKHIPMITEEEFKRVQILLGKKGKIQPKTRTFAFTGLIRCGECGSMITAEEKEQIICSNCKFKFSYLNRKVCPKCQTPIEKIKNPKILHYVYYHCTKKKNPKCFQRGIRIEELERQIEEYLKKIQISEEYVDWALKYLRKANKRETSLRNQILENHQKTYKECLQKLDNLLSLKISPENKDGFLLSDEEFKHKKAELLKEKFQLEELLRDSGQRVNKWFELSERTFNFAHYCRFWFTNSDLQTKREILSCLGSNLILKDKILYFSIQKPFSFIEEALLKVGVPESQKIKVRTYQNELKKASFEASSPHLLRG